MTLPLSKPAHIDSPPLISELFRDGDALASMPARTPLEMPIQSFSRYDRRRSREGRPQRSGWGVQLARLAVFGGALALTVYGAREMHGVVSVGGVTALEWGLLILFVVNFSWISLALTNAILGTAASRRRPTCRGARRWSCRPTTRTPPASSAASPP
jgi:membrane glycosyltransferase